MPLAPILQVTGRGVVVRGDDLDTDRIIPARYLKCLTFDGLGAGLFRDERFDRDGRAKGHPLDDPRFAGATILFAGANFGCGSSREHAPQAIFRFGLRAIVAGGFAEIFFGNSTTLGLPCVTASRPDLEAMMAAVESDPAAPARVDVAALRVHRGDQSWPVTLRESARRSLLEGRWDAIGDLLDGRAAARETAARLGYVTT